MFAKSALAIASVALFTQAASAATCTRKYTVKAGDYCDSISAANQVSTYQLGVINAGKINVACDNLYPGQELCLGNSDVDCKETVVVLAGNTCSDIWKKSGVSSAVFFENNPQVKKDCSNLYIDEVLCIAKTVQVPGKAPVPVHTGPPVSEATPPVPIASPPAPAPVAPTRAPVAPPPPPPVAAPKPPASSAPPAPPKPAPSPPAVAKPPTPPPAGDDEECEDEEEELEVVEGPTDEDLPFCDELE